MLRSISVKLCQKFFSLLVPEVRRLLYLSHNWFTFNSKRFDFEYLIDKVINL